MAAAAQLLALDGDQRLPARAACRQRHLEQWLWGKEEPPPQAASLPQAPAQESQEVLAGEQKMVRASTSSTPGSSSLRCSLILQGFPTGLSLSPPLSLAVTDQALSFSFPKSKIRLCQHLPGCCTANCQPEVVFKQQLHLLSRHCKAAKTLQFAIV